MSSTKKASTAGTTPEKITGLPKYFYTSPDAESKGGKIHSYDCATVHQLEKRGQLSAVSYGTSPPEKAQHCKKCQDKAAE